MVDLSSFPPTKQELTKQRQAFLRAKTKLRASSIFGHAVFLLAISALAWQYLPGFVILQILIILIVMITLTSYSMLFAVTGFSCGLLMIVKLHSIPATLLYIIFALAILAYEIYAQGEFEVLDKQRESLNFLPRASTKLIRLYQDAKVVPICAKYLQHVLSEPRILTYAEYLTMLSRIEGSTPLPVEAEESSIEDDFQLNEISQEYTDGQIFNIEEPNDR